MSSVWFNDVWKLYGAVEAVRGLELTCEDGEMLALLGPSGCGKSTTLKMAAGIEGVTSGEIFFDAQPVSTLAPGERNIAMVFEDYALYSHLTVFENIAFPLKIRHLRGTEIERRVNPIIELLGLEETRNDNVKALSGGAQQRISIGRALVREPRLILFDEPLSHLDADQKVQLRTEIKRLQQTTVLTAILVTHDQTEAVAMSDRVAVMNEGTLQQVARPDDLYHAPANLFVANFIGEPPMNLLPAEVIERNGDMRLVGSGWSVSASMALSGILCKATGGIVSGVRPEHVEILAPDDRHADARGRVVYREARGDSDVFIVRLDDGRGQSNDVRLTVETDADGLYDEGDPVALRIAADKVIAFDAETGRNMAMPP